MSVQVVTKEELPETHPEIVVYVDHLAQSARLACGVEVALVAYVDMDGEEVEPCDIDHHARLWVVAGPTPSRRYVRFGVSRDDARELH